jgi:hypothetical protein
MPSAETITRYLFLGVVLLALAVFQFVVAGRHSSTLDTWQRERAQKKKSERQRARREERKRVREEEKRAHQERNRRRDAESES